MKALDVMNIKSLIFYLLIFLFITNFKIYSQECESYRVMDIDSTESYYLIKVEKNEIKYLIVSSKRPIKPRRRIIISQSYNFKLLEHKWIEELPLNMMDAHTSLVVEDKTIWSTEDDYSVYKTKNLKGLNYVNRCSCQN